MRKVITEIIAIIAGAACIAGIAGIAIYTMNSQAFEQILNRGSNHSSDQLQGLKGVNVPDDKYLQAMVTVNGFVVNADIAITDIQREKGLSIKDHLNENQGMLFVFDHESLQPFWMKGMKFPIDIIWIDSNRRVVHIEHNLQPCIAGFVCSTYSPEKNSLYVLEFVAGFAQKHQVEIGTQLDFKLI